MCGPEIDSAGFAARYRERIEFVLVLGPQSCIPYRTVVSAINAMLRLCLIALRTLRYPEFADRSWFEALRRLSGG